MDGYKISLRQTLGSVSFVDCGDLQVSGICCDSRRIQKGDLFVALPGSRRNGRDCAAEAVNAGAAAVMLDQPIAGLGVPQCVVPNTRAAWAKLCMIRHKVPLEQIQVAGVTGTNGKTTTAWLLRSILQSAGKQTGLLGTIEYSDGRDVFPATLTTPDPDELAGLLGRMVRKRTSHCVMEVSSHALDQHRCSAVPLSVAAVTNVTQDHFDYHGSADHYRNSKAKIAGMLRSGASLLLGTDDPGCCRMLSELPAATQVLSFGMESDAVLKAVVHQSDCSGSHVELRLLSGRITFSTQLTGKHNVLNCLLAGAMAEQLGISPDHIVEGLERVQCVPGRMERISAGQAFQVIVDYAHTPDGLSHCLKTVRSLTNGRLICVFGAGGDRDRGKRPLMAKAAQDLADKIIVTSDNPRSESPAQIISEIMGGFDNPAGVFRCVDRASAIRHALQLAESGDSVVIAGRGHETVQQIGSRQISFDDRRVVRRFLFELSCTQQRDKSRVTTVADKRPSVSDPIPA